MEPKINLHFCAMKRYLQSWNLMRILRLGIGLLVVGQGIYAGDYLFVLLGGLFALMPLLNVGCGSSASCPTYIPRSTKKIEDTTYEDIHI